MENQEFLYYVDLAMKNLCFMKLQRENVMCEVKRLLESKTVEEVIRDLKK